MCVLVELTHSAIQQKSVQHWNNCTPIIRFEKERENFPVQARSAVSYLSPAAAATAFRLHVSLPATAMLSLGSPHQRLTPAEALGLVYFHPILGSLWGKSLLWIPHLDSLRNFQIYIAVRGSPCPILPLFIFLLTGKDAHHALELSLLNFTSLLFYALKTLTNKKLDVFYLHLSTCLPENSANTLPSNFVSLRSKLVRFLRMHTLQHFSCMYIWMYVFWMTIHQHIYVYFLLKFHVFISMHTYSKITLFHRGSHSGVFSASLYQRTNAHYLRGK